MSTSAVQMTELTTGRFWQLDFPNKKQGNRQAVVFVHGFTGDAVNTWKADAADSFPSLLATDPLLQDHDIFLFQYATSFFFPPEINNIVQQLIFALDEHLKDHSIVFVAHSMGGLVCMRYVLRQLENALPVRAVGLLMYGTPMTGVEWVAYARLALQATAMKLPVISAIGNFFSGNKQLEQIRSGGEFIDRVTSQWVLRVLNGGYPSIPANLRTWLPTRVVTGNDDWVVKESSAKGFYGDIDWIPLDKGHIALIKPASRAEESYQIARNFIKQCSLWIGPKSGLRLREQSDKIWNLHQRRRISDWKFEMSFKGVEAPAGKFGMAGFCEFIVKECSYRRFFDSPKLKFGFAFGRIASDNLWDDQFLFLHRILLRGLPQAESTKIINQLRALLKDPAEAWARFFSDIKVSVGKDNQSTELPQGPPVVRDDGIICEFELPERFVGREEWVTIEFRTLLPRSIHQYRIWFPWLCESFSATVTFERELAFFAPSQAMRGFVQIDTREEVFGRLAFQSSDLILPESYIQFEWLFAEKEAVLDAAAGT